MDFNLLPSRTREEILGMQKTQATAHAIYQQLAEHAKDGDHARILTELGGLELQSYETWAKLTGARLAPSTIGGAFGRSAPASVRPDVRDQDGRAWGASR